VYVSLAGLSSLVQWEVGVARIDIIRAWTDEDYRSGLTDEERALVPPNPAGAIELTDFELAGVAGGDTAECGGTGVGGTGAGGATDSGCGGDTSGEIWTRNLCTYGSFCNMLSIGPTCQTKVASTCT
jgi:mersacidin/lichenicidin family type 2 lantibiotic